MSTALASGILARLGSPYLLVVVGLLFLVDLLVPDPIPFVDETLLGLLTLLLVRWKARKRP